MTELCLAWQQREFCAADGAFDTGGQGSHHVVQPEVGGCMSAGAFAARSTFQRLPRCGEGGEGKDER